VPLSLKTGKAKTVAIFAPDPVPEDFAIKAGGALAIRPKSFLSGCYELAMAPEAMQAQAPLYGEIAMPVSILYGRQDALLDPELHGSKTAGAVQNGKVEMLGGGHMLPVTHVDATEAWLRGVASGS
jgi:pimeloyl-ACP methyl ester carboxylesterase